MTRTLTDAHLAMLTDKERASLEQARSIASWMDDKIKIGGFGVGLDGILGLIPVLGDLVSAAVGLYHAKLAMDLKLGSGTLAEIVMNLILDFAVGSIPLIGDLADFAYRSHRRNMKLIEKRLVQRLERPDANFRP